MLVHFNVGDTLKLRGTPKASDTKPCSRKCKVARLIASGKVIALKILQWTIRSQGPFVVRALLALHGKGSETRWGWVTYNTVKGSKIL